MKVAALMRGFSNGVYRRSGEEFDCSDDDFVSSWMVNLEKAGAVKPVVKIDDYVPLEIPSLMGKNREKPKPKKAKVKKEDVEQKQG